MADSGLTRRIRPSDLEEDPAEQEIRDRQQLVGKAILLERAAVALLHHGYVAIPAMLVDIAGGWREKAETDPG
jgi:hypothetical protein